jgi:hypothetical protein
MDNPASSRGSQIKRVELFLFRQDIENVAFDVNPGGIDMPGIRNTRTRLGVVVETRDGARGEYIGGRSDTYLHAKFLAKWILGMDAFEREQIYEIQRRQLPTGRARVGPPDMKAAYADY